MQKFYESYVKMTILCLFIYIFNKKSKYNYLIRGHNTFINH